jgi:hypothetical protein
MRRVEHQDWLEGLLVGLLSRSSSGLTRGREWVCCLVYASGWIGFCVGTGRRSWTGLQDAVGVMAGINARVACTLGGGVVGRCVGGIAGGGIGVGLVSQHGTWHVGGFTGGALDGEMVGGALELQLLAMTVSTLLSLLVRM